MNKKLEILDAMSYIDEKLILDAMEADYRQNTQDGVKNAQSTARRITHGHKLRKLAPLSAVAAVLVAAILVIPSLLRGFGVAEPPQSPGPADPFHDSTVGTYTEPGNPATPAQTQIQESDDEPETDTDEPQNQPIDQTEVTK